MIKIVHKVVTILVGVLIAKVTRALFTKAWRATAHQDEVPQPTDAQRRWAEVLLAAALQGMVIALVKAAVERAAAESTHKLAGVWTGENPEHAEQPEQAEKAPAIG
jgi:TRAP-type C4-dicarboxylate transport system permease small subunit